MFGGCFARRCRRTFATTRATASTTTATAITISMSMVPPTVRRGRGAVCSTPDRRRARGAAGWRERPGAGRSALRALETAGQDRAEVALVDAEVLQDPRIQGV